jgi:hypothetical protein
VIVNKLFHPNVATVHEKKSNLGYAVAGSPRTNMFQMYSQINETECLRFTQCLMFAVTIKNHYLYYLTILAHLTNNQNSINNTSTCVLGDLPINHSHHNAATENIAEL